MSTPAIDPGLVINPGAGIGLRPAHLHEVLQTGPAIPWFEIHSCNFLGGGLNRELLQQIGSNYPLSCHGVNLNLGGTDPLDLDYLQNLRRLIDDIKPMMVSEHACFCAHQGRYYHDLLPVPFTEAAARHMAARIQQVQDYLGRRILVENVSRYINYPTSPLSEAEFLTMICELADCNLILDLNNSYVNQHNLGEDARQFITDLPLERIGEVHVAGFSNIEGQLIDTHSTNVSDEVWQLYRDTIEQLATVPCLIEWDSELPPLATLLQEQRKATAIQQLPATLPGSEHLSLTIISEVLDAEYCTTLDHFCVAINEPVMQQASMGTYSNNLLAAHQNALKNHFLATRLSMEPSLFTALAQVYVQHYPAMAWDINLYGEQFPNLIAQQTRSAKAQAYNWLWLASLASIEYAICKVYYADNNQYQRDNAYLIESVSHQFSDNQPSGKQGTDIGTLLQQQHPYADISETLTVKKTIRLWRDNYRIQIENL